MSAPDLAALPKARAEVERACDHLAAACRVLRANGWPETADDLGRSLRPLQVWTRDGGWFDCLERPPIPMAEEEACPSDAR